MAYVLTSESPESERVTHIFENFNLQVIYTSNAKKAELVTLFKTRIVPLIPVSHSLIAFRVDTDPMFIFFSLL